MAKTRASRNKCPVSLKIRMGTTPSSCCQGLHKPRKGNSCLFASYLYGGDLRVVCEHHHARGTDILWAASAEKAGISGVITRLVVILCYRWAGTRGRAHHARQPQHRARMEPGSPIEPKRSFGNTGFCSFPSCWLRGDELRLCGQGPAISSRAFDEIVQNHRPSALTIELPYYEHQKNTGESPINYLIGRG